MSLGDDVTWLRYGVTATPVDEPGRTFGVVDDGEELTFGTFPTGFLRRTDVDVHEADAGRVALSAVDDDLYRRFGNGFESVELDRLVREVREGTAFTDRESRVLVLRGWFGLDRASVAAGLETTEAAVAAAVESARARHDRAERTADTACPLSDPPAALLDPESESAGEPPGRG